MSGWGGSIAIDGLVAVRLKLCLLEWMDVKRGLRMDEKQEAAEARACRGNWVT